MRSVWMWVSFVISGGLLGGPMGAFGNPAPTPSPSPQPQAVLAPASSPAPTASPAAAPAPAKTAAAHPTPHPQPKKITVTRKVVTKLTSSPRPTPTPADVSLVGANAAQRSAYEEAKNLIVPNQKYLIKFEDEENYGKVSESGKTSVELTFSEEDVRDYRESVDRVAQYRNQMRTRCSGASPRVFTQAIDRYLNSLSLFNRKALPLVADISENNPEMVLVVNRNVLVDAPVLISRYLQFKKQRFKETMAKFSPGDQQLIDSLVRVAKLLKVEINDSDWNKNYGVRENGLEMISMWPRETIFEATDRLAEARETVCIVDIKTPRSEQAKSDSDRTTGE